MEKKETLIVTLCFLHSSVSVRLKKLRFDSIHVRKN